MTATARKFEEFDNHATIAPAIDAAVLPLASAERFGQRIARGFASLMNAIAKTADEPFF